MEKVRSAAIESTYGHTINQTHQKARISAAIRVLDQPAPVRAPGFASRIKRCSSHRVKRVTPRPLEALVLRENCSRHEAHDERRQCRRDEVAEHHRGRKLLVEPKQIRSGNSSSCNPLWLPPSARCNRKQHSATPKAQAPTSKRRTEAERVDLALTSIAGARISLSQATARRGMRRRFRGRAG
jgi:hypothetical protein